MSRSRRGLAAWLTGTSTPLFVLDERHVVLVFNRGCEELTGWAAADIIGRTCLFQTTAAPGDAASLLGQLCPPASVLSAGQGRAAIALPRKEGAPLDRTVHFFLLPPEEQDEPPHILGLITASERPAPAVPPRRDLSRHVFELSQRYNLQRLIAVSPAMQRAAARLHLAQGTTAAVHLRGERGSGREHLARLIHHSANSSQRFIPLHCASSTHFELQRTLRRLLEDSFSDENRVTLFLGEVDRLPRDLQELVGNHIQRPGLRWMSSAIRDLDSLTDDEFPRSLAAELTTISLTIPPLRDRAEDLPLLIQQLVEETNQLGGKQVEGITASALRQMQLYNWPGNVGELTAVLQEAAGRCAGSQIDVADLPLTFHAGYDAQQLRPAPAPSASLDVLLEQFEREQIQQALAAARGNKSLAADRLGIPRPKLYRRLESLGLDRGDDEQPSESSNGQ